MREKDETGFLRVELPGGGEHVFLARLADGRVMCCICFEYCTRDQLEPVADELGKVWDVCRECAPLVG